MLASAVTKSAPARASAAQSPSVIAASARHGSTNSSLHHSQQLVHLRPRALPEVAEPDVVGAGFTRGHRRIARAPAGHAEDPLAAQRRTARRHFGRAAPKMDTVGADLKGEPDMVAHQAGRAALRAHCAHGRKSRAQAVWVPSGEVDRQHEPGDAADRERRGELLGQTRRVVARRADQQELAARLRAVDRLVRVAHASLR